MFPKQVTTELESILNGTPLWFYWKDFVSDYLAHGRSEVTVSKVREVLKIVVKILNILTIEDCNNRKLLKEKLFEAQRQRKWSNTTHNTYIKNINTYFIWLKEEGYIDENNVGTLRKSKEEQNEQYVLPLEAPNTLLGYLRQSGGSSLQRSRNELFLAISLLTGARPIELENMHVQDIRMKNGVYSMVINGRKQKGRKRYYNLPSWLKDIYHQYMDLRNKVGREEPYLFISMSKRTGWTRKGMSTFYKRLSKQVEIRVSAYAIRRYVATFLYLKGVAIHDIMQHLGHTRLSTTQRYIERSGWLTQRGVDVLGEGLVV